ncbi:MAG TPA: 2TM domain-containing protein [Flavobacterium sp.]|nr:2TM domain-containing protein [Flavobacterium sp.]
MMRRRFQSTFPEDRYSIAERKVKRIKSFYGHLVVYIIINCVLIGINMYYTPKDQSIFRIWNFSTAIFWGVGLAGHAFSVFGLNLIFGSNWEEKQIRKYMEKEKREKWE